MRTLQIPTLQPTALYQFSGSQLQQLINEIVSAIHVEPSADYARMNTRQVRQHLAEKGYRVKSANTLPRVLTAHGIKPIDASGKENWYNTEEIHRIPPKTRIKA